MTRKRPHQASAQAEMATQPTGFARTLPRLYLTLRGR
ncbi:hypothetical protein PspLS_11433 [Pyricularia sp. CBS 133598]|nr:hypothetical protein PspLS_11433 [Pyricularia sp. CBS 133598]